MVFWGPVILTILFTIFDTKSIWIGLFEENVYAPIGDYEEKDWSVAFAAWNIHEKPTLGENHLFNGLAYFNQSVLVLFGLHFVWRFSTVLWLLMKLRKGKDQLYNYKVTYEGRVIGIIDFNGLYNCFLALIVGFGGYLAYHGWQNELNQSYWIQCGAFLIVVVILCYFPIFKWRGFVNEAIDDYRLQLSELLRQREAQKGKAPATADQTLNYEIKEVEASLKRFQEESCWPLKDTVGSSLMWLLLGCVFANLANLFFPEWLEKVTLSSIAFAILNYFRGVILKAVTRRGD